MSWDEEPAGVQAAGQRVVVCFVCIDTVSVLFMYDDVCMMYVLYECMNACFNECA